MGYLVSNGRSGRVSYSGTQYMNPAHGTRRLCVRTGEGEGGIVRYGLTTDSSASLYCGLQVRVSGTPARIGRYEQMSSSRTNTNSSVIASTSLYTTRGAAYSGSKTSTIGGVLRTSYLGSVSSSSAKTELMDGTEKKVTVEVSVNSILSVMTYVYYTSRSSSNSRRYYTQSFTYASYTEHVFFEGDGGNNFDI